MRHTECPDDADHKGIQVPAGTGGVLTPTHADQTLPHACLVRFESCGHDDQIRGARPAARRATTDRGGRHLGLLRVAEVALPSFGELLAGGEGGGVVRIASCR